MQLDENTEKGNAQAHVDPKALRFLELYAKAKYKKDERAAFQLAELYRRKGTKDYDKEAYYLYKCAAAKDFAEGRYMMGFCLEHGIGVKQSYSEAVRQYIKADQCAKNDLWNNMDVLDAADSQNEFLRSYLNSPRFQEYVDQLFDAQGQIEQDEASAQQRYESGILCRAERLKQEKNYKEAAVWYRRYAEISIQYRKQRLGW